MRVLGALPPVGMIVQAVHYFSALWRYGGLSGVDGFCGLPRVGKGRCCPSDCGVPSSGALWEGGKEVSD